MDIHSIDSEILKQEVQNRKFRNAKSAYYMTSFNHNNVNVDTCFQADNFGNQHIYRNLLCEIYKSPSYKIIRGIRKINWKLRKRPKKRYFYPETEEASQRECIKILTSISWNFLGLLYVVYVLYRKLLK